MRTIFNPLANISAAETKKQQTNWKTNKKSKLHDGLSKSLNAISGSSTRDDKKQFKAFPNKKNSCWACKNDHKRMICDEFLNKEMVYKNGLWHQFMGEGGCLEIFFS